MKKIINSKFIQYLKTSPKTIVGLLMIITVLVMTLGAELFTNIDPLFRFSGEYQIAPNADHILGTTQLGRDVFAQTLFGGRQSILVGLLAAVITTVLSLFFGISSGYFGGVYDSIVSTVINIILCVPNIVLLLIIASLTEGVSPLVIALIIGFSSWTGGARVLRSQAMSIRNREFIYSAETLGESKFRILFLEIMPNMLAMISTSFVGTIIYTIMAQATLEFIGFGDPLAITWGTMLYNAQTSGAILSGAWWELAGPIAGLLMLGTGLTLLNFAIDEISNPKLSAQRLMKEYYRMQKKIDKKRKSNMNNEKIKEEVTA